MPGADRVFILYAGSAYPRLEGLLGTSSALVRSLTNHISLNGRCRTVEFMEKLAREQGAEDIHVIKSAGADLGFVSPDREILLLWTDAIGVGCRPLERRLLKPGGRVTVLTGRRRTFELTRRRWRSLQFRRVLEKYLIGEMFFTAMFLVTTPALVVWDWLRGRR